MKFIKKIGALFLVLAVFGLFAASVFASDYTYTVRIYSGAQGRIDGKTVIEISDLAYGDTVPFDVKSVKLKDADRYYVKGIRESGKDNSTVFSSGIPKVTRDQDYVIAYGIKGDSVAYTVEYVDAQGASLAESQTFYGNPGDKPVVAFRYIEGYQPQAYNLTGTLSNNEAANVFRFVYIPVGAAEAETTAAAATEETGAEAGAEEAAAGAEGAAGEAAAAPGTATEEGTPAGGEIAAPETPETPADIIDIDQGNVPLAGGGEETTTAPENATEKPAEAKGLSTGAIAGIAAGGAAVLVGIIAIIVAASRRKKKE